MLSSENLKELGVKTLGQQAILQEACKHANGYTKIAKEIRKIMQPLPDQPCSSGSIGTSSTLCIERKKFKPRKGGKAKVSMSKSRSGHQSFQKKLVVFKYAGKNQPLSFNRKDSCILLRGLLPEISLDASETEIRLEIMSVLHSSKEFDLSSFTEMDFQFIDVNGKHCVVPVCRENQELNARSVKQIAGTGAVYVRLTKPLPPRTVYSLSDDSDFEPVSKVKALPLDSDSSFELPEVDFNSPIFNSATSSSVSCATDPSDLLKSYTHLPNTNNSNLDLIPASVSAISNSNSTSISSSSNALTAISAQMSTPIDATPISTSSTSANSTLMSAATNMTQSSSCSTMIQCSTLAYGSSTLSANLHELQCMFPVYSFEELTTLLEICDGYFDKALSLLENLTLGNILTHLKEKFLDIVTEESPKIQTSPADYSSSDSLQLLLSFYKGNRFLSNAHVQVTVQGRNVIDSGGVRRQLYSSAFEALANGYMEVFDGPQCHLRPMIKPSNVVSGLLKNIGKAIAHSMIMDEVGFPYLSPAIYFYLAGKEDIAVTLISDSDVCGKALHVLSKLNSSGPDKLVDDSDDLQYISSVLDEAGSELPLEVNYKDEIVQTILMHNALHKRKIYLDSLAEGLEVYKIHTLIRSLTGLFKPLFTAKDLSFQDVINKIVPMIDGYDRDKRMNIVSSLFDFLRELSSQELGQFLCLVTGTHFITSDSILVDFTSRESDPPIAVHTCSRCIVFSTRVENADDLKAELGILLKENSFTMM